LSRGRLVNCRAEEKGIKTGLWLKKEKKGTNNPGVIKKKRGGRGK